VLATVSTLAVPYAEECWQPSTHPPYDSAKLLVNFHLEVEVKSNMPGAVRGRWVDVGVWMARIEERSNAGPEPRSAM